MLLNDLAVSLLNENGEGSDDAALVSRVEQWIKDALSEIADKCSFHHFESTSNIITAVGSPVYDLPINVFEVRWFRLPVTNQYVEYKDSNLLVQFQQDLNMLGEPQFWYYVEPNVNGADVVQRVRFFPVPDQIYTVEGNFLYDPNFITSSTTIPLNDYFILILKDRVRAYLYERDKDYDAHDRCYNRFLKELNAKIARENANPSNIQSMQVNDLPRRIGDRALARLDPSRFAAN